MRYQSTRVASKMELVKRNAGRHWTVALLPCLSTAGAGAVVFRRQFPPMANKIVKRGLANGLLQLPTKASAVQCQFTIDAGELFVGWHFQGGRAEPNPINI